jgi:hypothetical protein
VSFQQAAQLKRAKVNVPDSVVDLFEADVFTDAGD